MLIKFAIRYQHSILVCLYSKDDKVEYISLIATYSRTGKARFIPDHSTGRSNKCHKTVEEHNGKDMDNSSSMN